MSVFYRIQFKSQRQRSYTQQLTNRSNKPLEAKKNQQSCCDRDLEVQFLDGPHKRMIFLLQEPAGGCTCKALRCLSQLEFSLGGYSLGGSWALPTSARSLRIVNRLPSRAHIMLKLTSRHVLNELERPLLTSWVYLGPCLRIGPVVDLGWYEHCPYLKLKYYEEFKYVLQVDVVPIMSRPYNLVCQLRAALPLSCWLLRNVTSLGKRDFEN
ncbi:hypothetical protein PIB30_050668 [Stylosanthes scabra]|uniref:Uncharacterized protein n=1 Tax=Stylosanthes scabra TaxID=79078 RepID=A0ABU6XIK9_9FABA|nr:hypothetical protein [Stylosanthes scabra]